MKLIRNKYKQILPVAALVLMNLMAGAQILHPVKWSYAAKRGDMTHATIYFKADIEEGWHIYSLNQPNGGPVKTSFEIGKSKEFQVNGKPSEPAPVKKFDKTFGIDIFYFEKSVIFQQNIKLKVASTLIKGKLTYMVCNDHQCLPPEDLEFSIPIK